MEVLFEPSFIVCNYAGYRGLNLSKPSGCFDKFSGWLRSYDVRIICVYRTTIGKKSWLPIVVVTTAGREILPS